MSTSPSSSSSSLPSCVLVTGGTGFIGRKLIKQLVSEGFPSVVALARSPSVLPSGVSEVFRCDLASVSAEQLAEFMKQNRVEVVVHLAAVMNFYPSDNSHLWDVNVKGTKNLLAASIQAGVKRFIYISSTEAMGGKQSLAKPMNEDSPCEPFCEYGRTKVAAENEIRAAGEKLPYVILRFSGVIGPEDDFVGYELTQAVARGLFFFAPSSEGRLTLTHTDDCVQSILCAMASPKETLNQTYIVCCDSPMAYSVAISYIAKEVNRTQPIIRLPVPVIRVVTILLDPFMNLFKQKVFLFKAETIDRMEEDRWYSNFKAKRLLGFKPRFTMRDALSDQIRYMKREGQYNTWPISPVAVAATALLGLLLILIYRRVL